MLITILNIYSPSKFNNLIRHEQGSINGTAWKILQNELKVTNVIKKVDMK